MSRQFTDGEIVAAIKALAAEGKGLTRASVRDRLGGGGSTRISALLKEYAEGEHGGAPQRSGPPAVRNQRSGPSKSGPASVAGAPARAMDPSPVPLAMTGQVTDAAPEGGLPQLQSEIRVLKILLEEERNARREDEIRHRRTIEALQREIEIANRGRAE
ncbi:DNA-binding protein [Bradyrhizobium tropiciagri]|uniref:DNA-binding protein n=1 Tax=Bradyrhizobium tropiciagri TaxID=312253 RepID=UPI00067C63A2|nr:DNA-binding protein [Bradyrhizobium tropiciagri]